MNESKVNINVSFSELNSEKCARYLDEQIKHKLDKCSRVYASVKQDVIKFINELSQNDLPEIPD